MRIFIADSDRPVAVKSLEFLIKGPDSQYLQDSADKLLVSLKKSPKGVIPVDDGSLEGEALASSLESILEADLLDEGETRTARAILEQF